MLNCALVILGIISHWVQYYVHFIESLLRYSSLWMIMSHACTNLQLWRLNFPYINNFSYVDYIKHLQFHTLM